MRAVASSCSACIILCACCVVCVRVFVNARTLVRAFSHRRVRVRAACVCACARARETQYAFVDAPWRAIGSDTWPTWVVLLSCGCCHFLHVAWARRGERSFAAATARAPGCRCSMSKLALAQSSVPRRRPMCASARTSKGAGTRGTDRMNRCMHG